MAYDDDGLEAIFENDEPGIEGWDREWSEAFPRYNSAYRRTGRTAVATPRPHRPTAGVRGGTVQTAGGGRAQVTLPAAVTPKDAFDTAIKELKIDIAKQAEAIRKIDQTLDTNTSMLDKKINGVVVDLKKTQSNSQFSTMLPLLLNKTPQLTSFSVADPDGTKKETKVASSTFASGDDLGLLLAMMAMSGGMGGGSSGSGDNSSMMLMMLLAMGGLGKKS
jgi:hypothetical protein